MDNKIKTELEKARDLFYSWRLLEAYNIFRRYYDRLPFKPEPEHAQYIGMFVRTLLELGKEFELKFYMTELERIYKRTHAPEIGYQLAHVYMLSQEPNLKTARTLLNELLAADLANSMRQKVRICLAFCYDVLDDDKASVKKLIDAIQGPLDAEVERIAETWRAKVLHENGHAAESEQKLKALLLKVPPEVDWYSYFVTKHMLGLNYLVQDRVSEATQLLKELEDLFRNHNFKSVQSNLDRFALMIREKNELGDISVEKLDGTYSISYRNKTLKLSLSSLAEKLFVHLLKKRSATKEGIIKFLYRREYTGDKDDKLIYYQIHSLRKLITELGLPAEAIERSGLVYRLLPKVFMMEEPI